MVFTSWRYFSSLCRRSSSIRRRSVTSIPRVNSNLQKLPNRYMYIDEAEGSRAVGVHSAGIIEGLTKLYGATALVQELTGRR